MNATPQPPGWYDDPDDGGQLRYWDGNQWTADRSPKAGAPAVAQPQVLVGPEDYPVHLDVDYQEEYNRWLPLVKWLLLFPHYIVLAFLGIAGLAVWIVAAFAILFTGRYPEGMFNFLVGVQRWAMRVTGYHLLMTDEYPPFSLDATAGQTVRYDVEYPEQGVERWRPFVSWLLVYPYLFIANVLVYVGGILAFIALFAILFTKRYPQSLFDFNLVALRWSVRGTAYAYAMATRYPPWTWA